MKALLSAAFARLLPGFARRRKQRRWERLWSDESFDPPWAGRGVSPEIVAAVEDNWFSRGPVLDIGCGLGEVAAWFSQHGWEAVGVDIAAPAIERASGLHRHLARPPHFYCRDLTVAPAPDRQYRVLIDRGCFHQLPAGTERDFVKNLISVSAPDARLLLFVRAFRNGKPVGDASETKRQIAKVRAAFSPSFTLESAQQTYIDRHRGAIPEASLPAMVFRLRRVGSKGLPRFIGHSFDRSMAG